MSQGTEPQDRMHDHPVSIWTHPQVQLCTPLVPHRFATAGSMILRQDGRILALYSGGPRNPHKAEMGELRIFARTSVSTDPVADGWRAEQVALHHPECKAVNPSLVRARDGAIWVFYLGFHRHVWQDGEPVMEQTRSDVWCARSLDEGKSWIDQRIIFHGYCGATRGAIQAQSGALIVPISYVAPNPGRLVSACVVSQDNGATWRLGAAIDMGQHGDHAGAVEPTIVELSDGRIWILIRTNLGQFWEAFSTDDGLTWSRATPTAIRTPSAPGYLLRLMSGRIALIWNNTMARTTELEGAQAGRVDGRQLNMNLRDTLSIALSADEGRTWTTPVEVARSVQLSYPGILEIAPGKLLCRCQLVQPGWDDLKPVYFLVNEQLLLIQ